MKENDLKDLSRRGLITLVMKLNKKVNNKSKPTQKMLIVDDYKPVPKPRKSVKQMVQEYEDSIIPPPPQFRDDYKPVPKPRTKKTVSEKPVPKPRTKIEQKNKALKGYVKSFEVTIKSEEDPLEQLQNTRKGIENNLKTLLKH